MKVQYVLDALKAGANKFTVSQLTDIIRSDSGDKALARRTRRALFVARKAGIVLEPVRDGGKAVIAYQLSGAFPDVALAVSAPRKASKAKSTSVAKTTKTVKTAKVAKPVTPAKVAKKVRVTKEMQKAVAAKVAKSDAEVDAIKAANLEKMRAVTAKQKKADAKSRLTDEQKSIRDEFYAQEAAAEARFEERTDLRNNAPAFLFKENYSE